VFEDKLTLFAFKALTQTRRIEAGISSSWNYYRMEVYNYYYNNNGSLVESNMQVAPVPNGYVQHSFQLAYVTDNSYFGASGPINGQRSRVSFENYFGGIDYSSILVDYRKYFYIKPYTIAIRGFHFGRYGSGAEDSRLPGLYIGYPWYIRGYSMNTFKNADTSNLSVNSLVGSRIAVTNIEFRVPFTGSKRLALIKTSILPSDMVFFFDAGLAWQNGSSIALKWKPQSPLQRTPLLSTGVSIRINVLGVMVLEPYCAFPLHYGGIRNPVLGINFTPGW
jgi:outer membrane protein assembly factor BamA